ncbi:tectonic-1-like [Patiria miniata]|uniref:Tectonic domain-containing protein n=1 Tax=Patiria miniata TaxID=46514 RepID=A0A913ZN52_PATMI|nr:tectonic-1-like [Patiria miniata]
MAARCGKEYLFLVVKVAVFLPLSLAQVTTDSAFNASTQILTDSPGTSTDGLTSPGVVVTTESGGDAVTTAAGTAAAPPGPGEGATDIPVNTDIGSCICDLTENACDVNCCCDEDCTAEDRSSFTVCSDTSKVVDEQVCFRSTVIYTENAPETVNTSSSSFFCIVIDNNEGRNYYTVPDPVETVEEFVNLANMYGSSSFAIPDDTNATYGDFYKVGDSMYTLYQSLALGTLGLPRTSYSSLCDDSNPASFLLDQQTSCDRQLADLETECETTPYLSALTFFDGFKLAPTPRYLIDALPALNDTGEYYSFYANQSLIEFAVQEPVLCQDETGQQTSCGLDPGVVPAPSYDTQCGNVLLQVAYTITHNSSGAIEAVNVQLVLGNITSTTGYLRFGQKYTVAFFKADEVDTFSRSGNPGYIPGMPILAGNLVSQLVDGETRFSIELSSDRNNWLTVVKSTADGTCETNPDSRIPVNFGEDLRTGCMVSVTFSDTADRCQIIQDAALNALNGVTREYVATFGNSDVENVGDWVPILYEQITGSPSSSVEGTCNNMVVALHIEVIYANVGSLVNPQAKILGVRYNYAEGKTLSYTCAGAYCQTGSGSVLQNFEITSSVAFIDASTLPTPILAEDPGFEDKLPNDFFYPFTIGRSSVLELDIRLLWAGVLGYLVLKTEVA